jgi:rhodanese-related sulfurtransferase
MVARFLPLLLVLAACRKEAVVTETTVAEAAAAFSAHLATPVDANTAEYRDVAGHVPGAVLLSDFAQYPLSELPADKSRPLVFYCTSRM